MAAKQKTKKTRSYGTTQRLERRIARLYRAIYGKESYRNSELHRKILDRGLTVLEKIYIPQNSKRAPFSGGY